MARHDAISPDGEKQIRKLLLAGLSIARVAKAVGTCAKTVAVRRAKLKSEGTHFPLCGCGRSVNHIGCCRYRAAARENALIANTSTMPVGRTTVHPEYATHFRRAQSIEPPSADAATSDIVAYINAIVPLTYPEHIRDDIKQEMYLYFLEYDCPLSQLVSRLPDFIRATYGPIVYVAHEIDSPSAHMRERLWLFTDGGLSYSSDEYVTCENAAINNLYPGFQPQYSNKPVAL